MVLRFSASTIKGLEDISAEEIRSITGGSNVEIGDGRIFFEGDLKDIYRVNLRARTISRLYLVLHMGNASSLSEIYKEALTPEYQEVLGFDFTFAVRGVRMGDHEFTSMDVASAVGKAVQDYYLSNFGFKPRVNLDWPDVEIYAFLIGNDLWIGVNTTGESLHRRNYRIYQHPASLKTIIAAALLKYSGWGFQEVLVDPMCGGGTIPIEAARMARNMPPCLPRTYYPFMKLKLYDEKEYREELEATYKEFTDGEFHIYGVDISKEHVQGAVFNSYEAGVSDSVKFIVGDSTRLYKYVSLVPEFVVVNPPYGIRSSRPKVIGRLYSELLRVLYEMGCSTFVSITAVGKTMEEAILNAGFKLVDKRVVYHGSLRGWVFKAER